MPQDPLVCTLKTKPVNPMKVFHLTFGIVFILFAALQYNDPDPWVWMTVYLCSAFLCFLSIFNQKSPFFHKFYLIWGIFTAIWGIFQWPPVWEGLGDSMKTTNNELARESLGLFICSLIAILQYIMIFRKRTS